MVPYRAAMTTSPSAGVTTSSELMARRHISPPSRTAPNEGAVMSPIPVKMQCIALFRCVALTVVLGQVL